MNFRSQREKISVDKTDIYQNTVQWHQKFAHVFACPNTLRHEQTLQDLINLYTPGKKVLDLDCGSGDSSWQLLSSGASYVYGIDISERFIFSAQQKAKTERLDFAVRDVAQPIEGKFDVIFGRAILPHLDYQEVLSRLWSDNLNLGGVMIFMEPLGSNILLRLYWQLAKNAHTPDEKPFTREDLNWLKNKFTKLTIIPINYFSLFFGILSSKIFSSPNNYLLKICDILNLYLAKFDYIKPNYRQAIFLIEKNSM
jgi:2-polyprenyl-3-methyl-5-hydroxy-6-metoxy-1,4-benzoquinol methylase